MSADKVQRFASKRCPLATVPFVVGNPRGRRLASTHERTFLSVALCSRSVLFMPLRFGASSFGLAGGADGTAGAGGIGNVGEPTGASDPASEPVAAAVSRSLNH